jgi:hypothetical protein
MKLRNKKLDKKSKLKILKKYVNGESVAELVLQPEPITGFKFKFFHAVTGEPLPSWHEEKTYAEFPSVKPKSYPDPEIEGVSYNDPANVPEAQNSDDKTNVIESSGQTENPKESQKKPNRKQFLQQRLMEFAEQERIDLEIKSKEDFWIYANRSF